MDSEFPDLKFALYHTILESVWRFSQVQHARKVGDIRTRNVCLSKSTLKLRLRRYDIGMMYLND